MVAAFILCAALFGAFFAAPLEQSAAQDGPGDTVSFCENDPGHYPGWERWVQYTETWYRSCPPGTRWDQTCVARLAEIYQQGIKQMDVKYRQAVCSCWEQHPADPVARDLCILDAQERSAAEWRSWRSVYNPDACCVAVAPEAPATLYATPGQSFGQMDPGRNQNWQERVTYPDRYRLAIELPIDDACRQNLLRQYIDAVIATDNQYRIDTCECWNMYPANDEARFVCLHNTDVRLKASTEACMRMWRDGLVRCSYVPRAVEERP